MRGSVIARSASDEAIQGQILQVSSFSLDCFAALAMTCGAAPHPGPLPALRGEGALIPPPVPESRRAWHKPPHVARRHRPALVLFLGPRQGWAALLVAVGWGEAGGWTR